MHFLFYLVSLWDVYRANSWVQCKNIKFLVCAGLCLWKIPANHLAFFPMKPHYGIRVLSQSSGPGQPLPSHQLNVKSDTSLPSRSRKAALRGDLRQKSEAALRPKISPRDMPSEICVAKGLERGLNPSMTHQTVGLSVLWPSVLHFVSV